MASHLERHPGVRCTVNFVPVLLDQIEDYCDQLGGGQWRDPLLRIIANPDPDLLDGGREGLAARHGLPLPRADHARTVRPVSPPARPARLRPVAGRQRHALPGRQFLHRPRRLVHARVDRRKPAPRRPSGAATDGQGRCLRPRGPRPTAGRDRRRAAPADPALPRAGRARPDRTFLHPGQPSAGAVAARLQGSARGVAGKPAAVVAGIPGRALAGRRPHRQRQDQPRRAFRHAAGRHVASRGRPVGGFPQPDRQCRLRVDRQQPWRAAPLGGQRGEHERGLAGAGGNAGRHHAVLPQRTPFRPARFRVRQLARPRRRPGLHDRAAGGPCRGRQQPDPCLPGRRERLGVLPVQRLVLLFRPLRRARRTQQFAP